MLTRKPRPKPRDRDRDSDKDAEKDKDGDKEEGDEETKGKGKGKGLKGSRDKKPATKGSRGSGYQSKLKPNPEPTPASDSASVSASTGSGCGSGSFSVGVLPAGMQPPKGNDLFPELLRACFELERRLCPHRPPSAMVAINRHAQFRPHRDSGAGNGQTVSLIVGLGRYAGGELGVEGDVCDIRYRPLEFDGWSQRHWTFPFRGERFSLVFFSPVGVTRKDLFWLDEGPSMIEE